MIMDAGTVCDDGFALVDANVACKDLGFRYAVSFHTATTTEQYHARSSAYEILLDNVACLGSETSLLSCASTRGVDQHNCDHTEDVWLQCAN